MTDSADVVVAGAGVMGCGCAYWLSRLGYRVIVLERDGVASGASGMSAAAMGGVPSGGPLAELTAMSLRLHAQLGRDLPHEAEMDTGYVEGVRVRLAFTTEEAEALQAEAARPADHPVEWLEGNALWELEPRLSRAVLGGLVDRQLQVLAYRFVLALARAAEVHGAVIRHGEVVGLEFDGDQVCGVRLAGGAMLPTERVVLAMGPWTQRAAEWLGMEIPVFPVRGQLLELRVPDPQLHASLMHGRMYLVPKSDGITLAGTTEEVDSGFVVQPTDEGFRAILSAAVMMAPSLGEAAVEGHLAGLRPGSADGLPLIGPAPGRRGVYVLTGHAGRGLKLSAASTRVIADLIHRGTTELAIDAFAPGRFGPR